MLGTMTNTVGVSRTLLRVGSAVGATIALVGVAFTVFLVIAWHPLAAAPAWLTTTTAVLIVAGIASTVLFTAALARQRAR